MLQRYYHSLAQSQSCSVARIGDGIVSSTPPNLIATSPPIAVTASSSDDTFGFCSVATIDFVVDFALGVLAPSLGEGFRSTLLLRASLRRLAKSLTRSFFAKLVVTGTSLADLLGGQDAFTWASSSLRILAVVPSELSNVGDALSSPFLEGGVLLHLTGVDDVSF